MKFLIVGASLAGLRAAEAIRREGFSGQLTLIGGEPYRPYDRPPLSKAVLTGHLPVEHTTLAQVQTLDARMVLGSPAVELDRARREVRLQDGSRHPYDRVLIATGARARPFEGAHVLRGWDDALKLRQALTAGPRNVLVLGAGVLGCEIASAARGLGLPVTIVDRHKVPMMSSLGRAVGMVVGDILRQGGVDVRPNRTVTALDGQRAHLSDGTVVDVDLAVAALGAIPNIEWLQGSGLATGPQGIVCDTTCRAVDTDDIFGAGDVACWPHARYDDRLCGVQHWGNAVAQADVAGSNMADGERRVHTSLPAFWSHQFGINIKVIGWPAYGDQVLLTQGSTAERRFVAVYGRAGRTVAAVGFNAARWLGFYQTLVETGAAFPPALQAADQPPVLKAVPAQFPVLA